MRPNQRIESMSRFSLIGTCSRHLGSAGGRTSIRGGEPMRISRKTVGKAALTAALLFVVAVFLQWMGSPDHWPNPPHTLFSELPRLTGYPSRGPPPGV